MDTGKIRLTVAGVDVTQFVRTLNWSGNYENCARTVEAGIIQSHADPYLKTLNTAAGSPVSFSIDGETVFTGFVVTDYRPIGELLFKREHRDGLLRLSGAVRGALRRQLAF